MSGSSAPGGQQNHDCGLDCPGAEDKEPNTQLLEGEAEELGKDQERRKGA